MMFSSNAFRFVLVLAAASNAVTSATDQLPVLLGTAGDYTILTKSGISTVPDSVITGDIGVSPIAATAITGFSLTMDAGGEYWTSKQVVKIPGDVNPGRAFAANNAAPIPSHLTTAVSNMETAYTDAASRPFAADRLNLGLGILGGEGPGGDPDFPLTPGVYTFRTDVHIAKDIYFEGSSTDVFIIQMTGNLEQVGGTMVHLLGGALAKNIYWQAAGHVIVGLGAHLEGILLVKTDVLFETGSSLTGRVLAQTACVLQMTTIKPE
jgi:hypothetical protein